MKIELNLRLAKKQDFLEFKSLNDKGGKTYGMKYGVPYWLINSKGEIEKPPYRTHKEMDLNAFSKYMLREQVLVIIDEFSNNQKK